MTEKDVKAILKELENDQELLGKLSQIGDADELKALFKEKGLEISGEEAEVIMDRIGSLKGYSDDELDEEVLDKVSGGLLATAAVAIWTVNGILALYLLSKKKK